MGLSAHVIGYGHFSATPGRAPPFTPLGGGIRAALFGGTLAALQAAQQEEANLLLLVFILRPPLILRANAFAFHLTIQIERARPKRAEDSC